MPTGIYEFVKDVVNKLSPEKKDSVDVTFYTFQMIDSNPDLLAEYKRLQAGIDLNTLHQQIGKAVKDIEARENATPGQPPLETLKNIKLGSYTRFKPKA